MRLRILRIVVLSALVLLPAGLARGQAPLFDPNTLFDLGGRALGSAILAARDEVRRAGTRPIPPAMRQQLAQVFPLELLDRVTYRVGEPGGLALQALQYGHVTAMTLVDVIVFQKPEDAEGNDALWAHELTHVQQYERWGVEEFARRYVRDFNAVEDEAYAFQAEYEQRKTGASAAPAR